MPYKLVEARGPGAFVVTKATGRRHSKNPLPIARAEAQLRALNATLRDVDRSY